MLCTVFVLSHGALGKAAAMSASEREKGTTSLAMGLRTRARCAHQPDTVMPAEDDRPCLRITVDDGQCGRVRIAVQYMHCTLQSDRGYCSSTRAFPA